MEIRNVFTLKCVYVCSFVTIKQFTWYLLHTSWVISDVQVRPIVKYILISWKCFIRTIISVLHSKKYNDSFRDKKKRLRVHTMLRDSPRMHWFATVQHTSFNECGWMHWVNKIYMIQGQLFIIKWRNPVQCIKICSHLSRPVISASTQNPNIICTLNF